MNRQDIWRLWIALAEFAGPSFKPEGAFEGMEINLVDELPEGMVVVS